MTYLGRGFEDVALKMHPKADDSTYDDRKERVNEWLR